MVSAAPKTFVLVHGAMVIAPADTADLLEAIAAG